MKEITLFPSNKGRIEILCGQIGVQFDTFIPSDTDKLLAALKNVHHYSIKIIFEDLLSNIPEQTEESE